MKLEHSEFSLFSSSMEIGIVSSDLLMYAYDE